MAKGNKETAGPASGVGVEIGIEGFDVVRTLETSAGTNGAENRTSSGPAGANGVEGAEAPETGEAPKQRRKRGPNKAKEGGTGPAGEKSLFLDVKALAEQMQGMHAALAMLTRQPILAIADQEAEALAKSLSNLAVAYGWTTVIDPKTAALIGMGAVCLNIYGTRIMMLRELSKQRKAKEVKATAADAPAAGMDTNGEAPALNLTGFQFN